jgi:hypothetical protein
MVDNHKKSISWGFILALLFSVAIMALFFFALPIFTGNPSVVGAYGTHEDSATGLGTPIQSDGSPWFMYNEYSGDSSSYDIQAGNPKNGENIIGSYQVTHNADGTYTVTYNFDGGVAVVDQQLAISDSMNFTAKPGKYDNQDFGVPFSADADGDGQFYIFAHFSVAY